MSDYLDISKRVMRERECAGTQDLTDSLEAVLKGQAIELWSDRSGRLFLVSDAADVDLARRRYGAERGEIYTAAEIRRINRITNPEDVAAIHQWKLEFSAVLRNLDKETL